MIYLLSNNTDVTLTPEKLRALAHQREPQEAQTEPPTYQVHRLEARLGAKQVGDLVRRYETGESARSLATEYDVAPSALIRLLRERNDHGRASKKAPTVAGRSASGSAPDGS